MRLFTLTALLAVAAPVLADEPGLPPTVAPGAMLVEEYAANAFFEGPTWDPGTGKLYFTMFPKGSKETKIMRLDATGQASVWMDKTEGANGTKLSKDGRLLVAQAYGHRVLSLGFGPDGPATPKVLLFDKRLHQPNDVCQAPNGTVYFTDPDFSGKKTGGVYMIDEKGKAKKVIDQPVPNGLQVSADGKTLYVGDDELDDWRAYPIGDDGMVGSGKVFFKPDLPNKTLSDGMTIDEKGNLYFSGQCNFPKDKGGVWVVSPEGKALGRIATPTFCSYAVIGGPDGKTLYLTCEKHVYSLKLNVGPAKFFGK